MALLRTAHVKAIAALAVNAAVVSPASIFLTLGYNDMISHNPMHE